MKTRNPRLEPRLRDIAKHYKTYGEAWRVRWDYAFYQMVVETNFLTYRTGTGRMGDVDPAQNNFAGIGTTGGGVPGDGFPDVKTGVHAQIQHLVVYSGERLAAPIAARTKLKQEEILEATSRVDHPMRFADLARRWAVDKAYGSSIEWVADSYRKSYCTGKQPPAPVNSAAERLPWANGSRSDASESASPPAAPAPRLAAAPKPAVRNNANPAVRTIWTRENSGTAVKPKTAAVLVPGAAPAPARMPAGNAAPLEQATPEPAKFVTASDRLSEAPVFDPALTPPSGLGGATTACSIASASYGGKRAVLIRHENAGAVTLTALRVLEGFEASMTANFINARAPGGASIGDFASQDDALAKARALCPAATQEPVASDAARG